LADQGLTSLRMRVPQWKMPGVPLGRLDLEPGGNLINVVARIEPGILSGQHELPRESYSDAEE